MCSDFSSSNDGVSVSLLIVRVQYMLVYCRSRYKCGSLMCRWYGSIGQIQLEQAPLFLEICSTTLAAIYFKLEWCVFTAKCCNNILKKILLESKSRNNNAWNSRRKSGGIYTTRITIASLLPGARTTVLHEPRQTSNRIHSFGRLAYGSGDLCLPLPRYSNR